MLKRKPRVKEFDYLMCLSFKENDKIFYDFVRSVPIIGFFFELVNYVLTISNLLFSAKTLFLRCIYQQKHHI